MLDIKKKVNKIFFIIYLITHCSVSFSQDKSFIPYTNSITDDKEISFMLNIAFVQISVSENFDAAIEIYKNILLKTEKKFGKDSNEHVRTLIYYSQCLGKKGDYKTAIDNALKAYDVVKDNLNGEDVFHHVLLNGLGAFNHAKGDYAQALTFYLKALSLYENATKSDKNEYAMLLNNIANLYDDIGQTEKAIEYLEKSLGVLNTSGSAIRSKSTVLHNLSLIYNKIDNFDKSFKLINESLLHTEKFLGVNSSTYAKSLNVLGINYQDTEQYQKSLSSFFKALGIIDIVFGKENINSAAVLNNIGRLKAKTNELDDALTFFQKALNIIENQIGKENSQYRNTLYELILVSLSQEKYSKALPLLRAYNSITLNEIKNNFIYQTAKEKQDFVSGIIGNQGLNHFSNFNYLTNNNNSDAISFALNNILTSKGLVLNATKDLLTDLKKLNDKSLNDSIISFIERRKYITKQLQLPIIERDSVLKKVQNSSSNLERVLVNTHKKHFKSQGDYLKDFKNTKLKDKELAIEFTHFKLYNKKWTDSTMYVAYLYRKGWNVPKVINLFEEKELKEYFEKYSSRGVIAVKTKSNEKVAISELLYELIWKPLEVHLDGVETIYYSPDGLLHKVPINALPTNQGRFLGELYNINRVGNTATVNTINEFPNLNSTLLIGDITYDYTQTLNNIKNESSNNSILKAKDLLGNKKNKKRNAFRGSWSYLSGTKDEIEFIQEIIPKSEILRKTEATETKFKQLSGNSPSVLHISTHGYFFPDVEKDKNIEENQKDQNYVLTKDPLLRSGLIFANANYAWQNGSNPYENDDGILTALEISNLDFRNTDIVILSACDTGLGDIPSSEGVYGLQRAFKMAGVNTIIMTLWEVPDKETAEFMKKFYTKWNASNNSKEAFKYAQNFMIKKYRYQPNKWAAFVYFE